MRILFVAVLFLLPSLASAQILFNEIELLPTDERFVELYNSGDTDVVLTGWYIQRKTATGSTFGSLVSSSKFENKIISAHGYFLIARSAFSDADIVLDSLSLTESNALQLKNPEREIVDQIAWEAVSEGKSYQKLSSGEWVIWERTPRTQNKEGGVVESLSPVAGTITNSAIISGDGSSALSSNQKIAIDIGHKERVALVGIPIAFEGRIEGTDKKPIQGTQMKWSFGDGAITEGWGIANVSHTYYYPGEYNVFLNLPAFFTTSSRVRVRVVVPEILVRVEDHYGRSVIIIENRMHEDLDLSGWKLFLEGRTFTFPMTIVSAKKSVAFPSEITLLTANEESHPELFFPNGVRVPMVSPKLQNVSSSTSILIPASVLGGNVPSIKEKIISNTKSMVAVKETASLVSSASSQQARLVDATRDTTMQTDYVFEKQNEKMWVWYISIFFLVSLALAGFLLIRSKKTLADEFEIIEETEKN